MIYGRNGKDIMAPVEYMPKFNCPNEKDMFCEGFIFEVVMVMLIDLKKDYKMYNVNKNQLLALREVNKSNFTSSF